MKDVLEMQLNASYYEAGVVALGSFLKHNRGFTVRIRDIGLLPSQAAALRKSATVLPSVKFDSRARFPHVIARLEALQSLVADGGMTLLLDADTVTNDSISEWLQQLRASTKFCSLVREEAKYRLCQQVDARAERIFPHFGKYSGQPGYNWGVMLIHRTPESVQCLARLAAAYLDILWTGEMESRYFKFLEQSFGNCYLFEHSIPILEMDQRYNALVRTGDCHARDGRFYYRDELSFVVHFIGALFRRAEQARPDANDIFGLYQILRMRYLKEAERAEQTERDVSE